MRMTTLPEGGGTHVGLVHASVEGVDDEAVREALELMERRAHEQGADAVVGIQLAQSNFQWNPRTTVVGTAVKRAGAG
ncbi:MAG: heavy metal-binding domain-containing protein [Candidatus Dormibacteria bacterium]